MLSTMELVPEFFPRITAFEWDEGNSEKNWHRHEVRQTEAEQVFLNRPLVVVDDPRHSGTEARFYALGRTDRSRLLAAVFTLRDSSLRVISVRPMSRKERRMYAQAQGTEDYPSL
ncbi:MAG: BrnT family toxin [Candidatus Latescibacterota bacterium]|jgi:hypothetical protein